MVKITFRIWILIIALMLALLMIYPRFQDGVVIKSVDKDYKAFESGLRPGMEILEINSIKSFLSPQCCAYTSWPSWWRVCFRHI